MFLAYLLMAPLFLITIFTVAYAGYLLVSDAIRTRDAEAAMYAACYVVTFLAAVGAGLVIWHRHGGT